MAGVSPHPDVARGSRALGDGVDRPVLDRDRDDVGVSGRAVTLAELATAARGHADRARAASTERSYADAWTRFQLWCGDLGLEVLPAEPLTVALYVAHLAPAWRPATDDDPPESVVAGEVRIRAGLAPASIARHLAAISVHHRAAGHPSPTRDPRVGDVLSGVRRHGGVAAPRRVTPALTADVQAMVVGLDGDHDPAAARDAALILIAYTAALRRSELAALTLADIAEHPDGVWIEVFLASSKTDQHRAGHTVRIPATGGPACPVTAWMRWRRWLTAADEARAPGRGDRLAPAFRAVRKGATAVPTRAAGGTAGQPELVDRAGVARRLRAGALTDRSIAEIVKRRATAAGLSGTWSGHSPRRGFATQAYTAGVAELEIMRHGRWRSQATMRHYIAEADRRRADSPITSLGLGTAPVDGPS